MEEHKMVVTKDMPREETLQAVTIYITIVKGEGAQY